jgi:glycosyltransferase involved in cell wall biosynthesis
MEDILLSVIVPAYNEEKRLPNTLKAVGQYLSGRDYNYEIVVVNDGSKDGTARITKELTSQIEGLRLIDNKDNHGKGYVVKQGMMEAKGKYRLFMDADNSTTVDHVEKMLPYFDKGFDVVIGSREIEGAILDPPQGFVRRMTGAAFRLLTNIFTGLWELEDTQCGFKCFTAKAVEDVFPSCVIDRFSFDPELLVVAKKRGYRIKEVPIKWINDVNSKVKFKNMVKMGFDLIKIRMNLIKRVYDKKE